MHACMHVCAGSLQESWTCRSKLTRMYLQQPVWPPCMTIHWLSCGASSKQAGYLLLTLWLNKEAEPYLVGLGL